MPQGQCMLPPDQAGPILDRLAGLERFSSLAAVRQALAPLDEPIIAACTLTHELVCSVVCQSRSETEPLSRPDWATGVVAAWSYGGMFWGSDVRGMVGTGSARVDVHCLTLALP